MEMQPRRSTEALFSISAPIGRSLPKSSGHLASSFCRSKIYLHTSTCDCGFRWRERRQIPKPAEPEPKRLRYHIGGRGELARGQCRRGLLNATTRGLQEFFLVTTGLSSPVRFPVSATPRV